METPETPETPGNGENPEKRENREKLLPSRHTYHTIDLKGTRWERGKEKGLEFEVIRLEPDGWMLMEHFVHIAPLLYNFEFRPSDVSVNSFIKSGTTWVQEIVWNLLYNPDLDNPRQKSLDFLFHDTVADMFWTMSSSTLKMKLPEPLTRRFNELCPGQDPDKGLILQTAAKEPGTRLIKSHFPINLWNPDMFRISKAIYIVRDARDMLLSSYNYSKLNKQWESIGQSLDELIDDALNDNLIMGPYWQHVKVAWDLRHEKNFCFLFYEDLISDPFREIKKIDRLLQTNRTDDQIRNVVGQTSFATMKKVHEKDPPTSFGNQYLNQNVSQSSGFFNKGKSGYWKEVYTECQSRKITDWMKKNLEQFDDDFKYKKEFE